MGISAGQQRESQGGSRRDSQRGFALPERLSPPHPETFSGGFQDQSPDAIMGDGIFQNPVVKETLIERL
jgi:hypothetical protein